MGSERFPGVPAGGQEPHAAMDGAVLTSYPLDTWTRDWLDRVDARMAHALRGPSAMCVALSDHFADTRGKRLRPTLVLLGAGAVGAVTDDVVGLGASVELVHMATLVHDDIVDGASTRRGVATPNAKWGDDWAILTGDFLFARAFGEVSGISDARVVRSLSGAVSAMCEGEWDQLADRHDLSVDVARYERRIAGKTAAFMAACCECGAALAGGSPDEISALLTYGHELGMAFQIVDDLLDYDGTPSSLGKPVGGDLRDGTFTLPLILALGTSRGDEVRELVAGDDMATDPAAVSRVIELIRALGCIESAANMAHARAIAAVAALETLVPSAARESLARLAAFVCEREH